MKRMEPEEKIERNSVRDEKTGCWLWTKHIHRSGYGITSGPRKTKVRVHRMSWEVSNGAIPDGLWVLHKCDVRHCVNPAHLFLGDAKANSDDKIAKGRGKWGKLNRAQVEAIRADGRTKREIARDYGISMGAVKAIRNRRTYKWVP